MEDAINRVGDFINGIFQYIGSVFTDLFNFFDHLSSIIESVVSFVLSIFGFIRYGGKTLITGIYKLLYYIFSGSVFVNVNRVLIQISDYIGGPATVFISCVMLLVIVRIIIAFVFKIFRRDLDYKAMQKKKKAITLQDAIEDMKGRGFFDS